LTDTVDKVGNVKDCALIAAWSGGAGLTDSTDAQLRAALAHLMRAARDPIGESFEVLDDGGKVELITCA
jgi:hypothetical protein